jgi:hypothetical protein
MLKLTMRSGAMYLIPKPILLRCPCSGRHNNMSLVDSYAELQRFVLKPKPRDFLKGLLCKPFKKSLVVRLIGNCCK